MWGRGAWAQCYGGTPCTPATPAAPVVLQRAAGSALQGEEEEQPGPAAAATSAAAAAGGRPNGQEGQPLVAPAPAPPTSPTVECTDEVDMASGGTGPPARQPPQDDDGAGPMDVDGEEAGADVAANGGGAPWGAAGDTQRQGHGHLKRKADDVAGTTADSVNGGSLGGNDACMECADSASPATASFLQAMAAAAAGGSGGGDAATNGSGSGGADLPGARLLPSVGRHVDAPVGAPGHQSLLAARAVLRTPAVPVVSLVPVHVPWQPLLTRRDWRT